jgi:protein-tyrosine-phosphatase
MAEGLLKAQVMARAPAEVPEWRIESAGVWAQEGQAAAANTQLIVKNKGIDLSGHLSQPVTRQLVEQFNLVLAMERGQKEALRAAFPDLATRVILVSELVGERFDIVDPIGGPMVEFEETARELEEIFSLRFNELRRLAADRPGAPTDGNDHRPRA